jgi:hypothetical protein
MADDDVTAEVLPARRRGRKKGSRNRDKKALLDALQAHVYKTNGRVNWDPVLELSEYGSIPWSQRFVPAKDQNGEILRDDSGNPVMIETFDPVLKVRALEQIAQYVHPKLKALEHNQLFDGKPPTINYFLTVDGEEID